MMSSQALVANAGGDARLDQFTALVAPFGLVVGEQRQAVAAGPLLPVRQPGAAVDEVAGAHGDTEGVGLAAVEDVLPLLGGLAGDGAGRLEVALGDGPGEGVEVLRGHDAAVS